MTKTQKILIAIGVVMVLSYGATKFMPRGLRNKNPGNIRHNPANDWNGMVGQDEGGFVVFSGAHFGIRAIGKIIDSYQRRGVWMLRDVIEEWAPPEENQSDAYLSHVMFLTGWQAAQVPQRTEGDYVALVKAIIKHENGINPFTDQFITDALAMA